MKLNLYEKVKVLVECQNGKQCFRLVCRNNIEEQLADIKHNY